MRSYKSKIARFLYLSLTCLIVLVMSGITPSTAEAQSIPDCYCTCSGTLPNGDRFFGDILANLDVSEPEGRWMHINTPVGRSTPPGVLLGTFNAALCRPNGVIRIDAEGTGLFTGLPVEFRIAVIDGRLLPDAYRVEVFDAITGILIYYVVWTDHDMPLDTIVCDVF